MTGTLWERALARRLGAAVALALWAASAEGAPLDVETAGPASVGSGAFDFVPEEGELSGLDVRFVTGPAAGLGAAIFFDPEMSLPSLLDLDGAVADVIASGSTAEAIQLRTERLAGFPSGALVTLGGFGLAPDPDALGALIGAGRASYPDVRVTLEAVAPIPVPAAGLLMGLALAALGLLSRRRPGPRAGASPRLPPPQTMRITAGSMLSV